MALKFKNKKLQERFKRVSKETRALTHFNYEIADRIAGILKDKDISQKEFAGLMKKNESEISKWLSGTHNFTIETIVKISLALKENIIVVFEEPNLILEFHGTWDRQSSSFYSKPSELTKLTKQGHFMFQKQLTGRGYEGTFHSSGNNVN